ncbi:hypothetical protein GQ55_9G443000 [Panicum hallii var. hallii]|uniref:Cytochrome P450 n=1 Tax=Panicum hallii var. hallii TaxID=1504633 RepID=A0A2T7CBP8_9POAL|nr:hypothetical protein GQ55_9G443000 [Panicum hallii var. hallii]
MDASTTLFVAVSAIIFLAVALKQLLSGLTLTPQLKNERAAARLPPGSTGLPLLGDMLRLISAYRLPNPDLFIHERIVARHGAMSTTHLLGERAVFSADPSFNRLVLSGDGRVVDTSYPSSVATLLGARSVLVTRGPAHKGLHALALARLGYPALPPLVARVDRLVLAAVAQWEPAGAAVRLVDEARKIAMSVNVHLLGIEPGPWSESLRREFNAISDGFVSLPFPLASLLPFTTYGKALKARKNVALALQEVVRKRMDEKAMDAGADGETAAGKKGKKDMVDLLLEADGGSFSMEQMVDFCVNLLAAGYDTTSLTMTLAVKFLTETPTALAQLREEHDSIRKGKGENQSLEWSDYQSMAFTQCVINETLRVGNIVNGVLRRANTDIHFKDYIIPKGYKIFASFGAVHLSSEHYENARTFHPWRWQSKNSKVQDVPASNLFTPFGGGPRQCPGNELARVVVSVFLHHLVTRFSWDEAEEDKVVFFPTTRTLKGYPINVRLRSGSIS